MCARACVEGEGAGEEVVSLGPLISCLCRGVERWKKEEEEGEHEIRKDQEAQRQLRRLDVRIGHMLRYGSKASCTRTRTHTHTLMI